MKVLICTPASGGMVDYRYAMSLLTEAFNAPDRLANLKQYELAINLQQGNSGLPKDRNIMASKALRDGWDKVLFIDADQSWNWNQMKKILASPHPITAGMVPLKTHPIQLNFTTQPADASFFENEAGVVTPLGIDRWRAANAGNDYIKVSAVGTGFLCIDTSVLQTMVQQGQSDEFLFKEVTTKGPQLVKCWDFFPVGPIEKNYYGEDYSFCIMAQRAGFGVFVDTSLELPHYGNFEYRVDQGRGVWAQLYLPFKKDAPQN